MVSTFTFLVSQAIGAVMRVDVLLVVLGALTLLAVLRRKPDRARLHGTILSLTVLFFTFVPVGNLAVLPLERAYPTAPDPGDVEGIIILGGGETRGTFAGEGALQVNGSGDRFLSGLRLAALYPKARVLFSGGRASIVRSEAGDRNLGAQILLEAGLEPSRLIVEGQSRNTTENARLARDAAPVEPEGTWVLVTSAFHMRRAVGVFCSAGWTRLVPWPTDHRAGRQKWPSLSRNIDLVKIVLRERIGWIGYRLTGKIDASRIEDCLATP